MTIYQDLNEAEEKAIDSLVLTLRLSEHQKGFNSGTKYSIDELKKAGFTEAAAYLEDVDSVPF